MRKIIMASITAVVVIAVLAGTLIPILDDATETERTFDNSIGAQSYMEKIGSDTESYTFVFDGTNNPGYVTVNGEDVRPNKGTLLCIDGVGLVRNHTEQIETMSSFRVEFGTVSKVVTAFNFTITNGVASYTSSSDQDAVSVDVSAGGFGLIDDGDYVMTDAAQDVYLLKDSPIYGQGLTNIAGAVWNTQTVIEGTIEDGITVTTLYPPTPSITYTTPVIDATALGDYVDLYDFNKITFTASVEGSNDTNVTYNRLIVPAEVTAEKSVHFTDGENAIFNAIPVIVIVALLLAVVALVLRSRMD